MSDIVNLFIDELVSQIEATSVDYAYRGPRAEHMQQAERSSSIAVVYANDPYDDEWRHGVDESRFTVGSGSPNRTPFIRRFTIKMTRIYQGSTREDAQEDFGGLMREVEKLLYQWTTTVGPDSSGERANISCNKGVFHSSREEYQGGEDEFVANGKLWVEVKTS